VLRSGQSAALARDTAATELVERRAEETTRRLRAFAFKEPMVALIASSARGAPICIRNPVQASANDRPVVRYDRAKDTAVVFIDPQNDVLSEQGTSWEAVGASVIENNTRENMERIFKSAKANGYHVFISPHYFYPTDGGWKFNGPLEGEELRTHTFARSGPLDLVGFPNSGADWLDRFKPYINDGKTVVVSPHKVWAPQTNDLVLQLGKRRINKIILGGMLANICVESHPREFLERGFEVAVVKDATAGPRHPVWGDGYQAAMINYRFLAHAVWSTNETVARMSGRSALAAGTRPHAP